MVKRPNPFAMFSMLKKLALAALVAASAASPALANVNNVELEAYVYGSNDFASCEIKSGGSFFEQELVQDSLTEANLAVGNAPTGIQLEATGDVTMAVSTLTEVKPGDGSVNLNDSYIDVKLAGGGFGNEVLRSDGSGGESKDFTNLRGATTNVQMTDARITVDGGMSTGTEYRTQTVLSCIVTP